MHEDALENHWMNSIDDYDVKIRDYFRMTLYLVEKELKMKIPLKAVEKDTNDVWNLMHNRDKIYDRPIINAHINNRSQYIV